MYITTSKNADVQAIALAKSLASILPGITYLPRSKRPLDKLAEICDKKSNDALLVIMQKDTQTRILKYTHAKENEWEWCLNTLEISDVQTTKIQMELPVEYCPQDKDSQDICKYFEFRNSPDLRVYAPEERTEITIHTKKNLLNMQIGTQGILSAKYRWTKWQRE